MREFAHFYRFGKAGGCYASLQNPTAVLPYKHNLLVLIRIITCSRQCQTCSRLSFAALGGIRCSRMQGHRHEAAAAAMAHDGAYDDESNQTGAAREHAQVQNARRARATALGHQFLAQSSGHGGTRRALGGRSSGDINNRRAWAFYVPDVAEVPRHFRLPAATIGCYSVATISDTHICCALTTRSEGALRHDGAVRGTSVELELVAWLKGGKQRAAGRQISGTRRLRGTDATRGGARINPALNAVTNRSSRRRRNHACS